MIGFLVALLFGVVALALAGVLAAWRRLGPLRRAADEAETDAYELASELAEANNALEVYARAIAHEAREPLRAIGLAVSRLLERVTSPGEAELAAELVRIMGHVERGRRLLDTLTQWLRVRTRDQAGPETVDLDRLVALVFFDLQDDAKARGCELETTGRLGLVLGDAVGLRLAVSNLVSNAIKYGKPQRADEPFVVRVLCDSPAYGVTRLKVADQGPGIAAALLEHIWEPFTRGVDAGRLPGSGLGLAIVAEVARQAQGAVGVTSDEGRGATFWIELPRA